MSIVKYVSTSQSNKIETSNNYIICLAPTQKDIREYAAIFFNKGFVAKNAYQ